MVRRAALMFVLTASLVLLATACGSREPVIIFVTATPEDGQPHSVLPDIPGAVGGLAQPPASNEALASQSPPLPLPTPTFIPTPEPTRMGVPSATEDQYYVVQAGDTLALIAGRFNVSVDSLVAANNLTNANVLSVGQNLLIPLSIQMVGPAFKIIPDSELVYGPGVRGFSVERAMEIVPNSYLAHYSEELDGRMYTGPQIVERVAIEQSVNPRLLLALLEFQSRWLSRSEVAQEAAIYPMGYIDQPVKVYGLYRQLDWAAKMLQSGYYGWRLRGLNAVLMADGLRAGFDPSINAGTAGVQYLLAQTRGYDAWYQAVLHSGFFATYVSLFGDPFLYAVEPLLPSDLTQPTLSFPWADGETWYFTGGPHGGWGMGSAWAALDFVSRQETEGCDIDPAWVAAMADGVIARSEYGLVVLDLDGDGDPGTGWTIVYLHVSSDERAVAVGDHVKRGDPIGHPSCEGGFSTATHVHIGRRYNGEWISADCTGCIATVPHPPFVMEGWTVYSFGREYDGSMERGDDYREACACRADFNTLVGGR